MDVEIDNWSTSNEQVHPCFSCKDSPVAFVLPFRIPVELPDTSLIMHLHHQTEEETWGKPTTDITTMQRTRYVWAKSLYFRSRANNVVACDESLNEVVIYSVSPAFVIFVVVIVERVW